MNMKVESILLYHMHWIKFNTYFKHDQVINNQVKTTA